MISDKLKPDKLLRLAKKVFPQRVWMLYEWKGEIQVCEDVVTKDGQHHVGSQFDPIRYKSQLADCIFALFRKASCLSLYYDGNNEGYQSGLGDGWDAKGNTKEEAIMNLCYKVLCNAD